jgi:hypothetical protein
MPQRIPNESDLRSESLPSFATDTDAEVLFASNNAYRARTTIVPGANPSALEPTLRGTLSIGHIERLLSATDEPFADPWLEDADDDADQPTQTHIPTITPQAPRVDGSFEAQHDGSRDFSGYGHRDSVYSDQQSKDKWYLRLELRTDCLADLWIKDQTPHNVLAWSDGMESWVPLLTVPELREAIRSAQDKKTRDLLSQPPPALNHSSQSGQSRIPLPPPRSAGAVVSTAKASPAQFWSMPHPRPVSSRPPPVPTTVPAPPRTGGSTVPPVLGNTTASSSAIQVPTTTRNSYPPASMEVPSIPRPARVPQFSESTATLLNKGSYRPPPNNALSNNALVTLQSPHGTLTPPAVTVIPPVTRSRSENLVNLERVLWLAAGVSVATAGFFIFGSHDAKTDGLATNASVNVGGGKVPVSSLAANTVASHPATTQGQRPRDVAAVEDLPLVGSKAARESSAKWSSHGRSGAASSAGKGAALTDTGSSKGVAATALPAEKSGSASPIQLTAPGASEGVFNPAQARRVLSSAASRAQSCADGPVSGSVMVTFAPSGFVQGASLNGLTGENVRSGCVLRAFQEARVSPFSGDPVSVKKSF